MDHDRSERQILVKSVARKTARRPFVFTISDTQLPLLRPFNPLYCTIRGAIAPLKLREFKVARAEHQQRKDCAG